MQFHPPVHTLREQGFELRPSGCRAHGFVQDATLLSWTGGDAEKERSQERAQPVLERLPRQEAPAGSVMREL